MKSYLLIAVIAISFSSCLKQSIADAMLDARHPGRHNNIIATLSYELNGAPVKIEVTDADNQATNPFYTLGCSKDAGYYVLSGLSNSGETIFLFYTDTLTAGTYTYTSAYGDQFFISYNGANEYVHDASDNLTYIITSAANGHTSGTFSGRLTPLISSSSVNDVFGDPGSIHITNGVFQNIPVFY